MSAFAFGLYLIFLCSWFLHLAERFSILGAVRFDLVLVFVILVLTFAGFGQPDPPGVNRRTQTALWVLVIYLVVTMPFVEWPGSVLSTGFPQFVRAFVFFFFTARLATTPTRLKCLLFVFVACETFRVLEPWYLHMTQGYWGEFASMANWETMDRLSGAPSDVVNPNGLAFIVLTVLPFIHYLTRGSVIGRLTYLALLPVLIHTLVLTGSRSGMVGLACILALVWWKSSHKVAVLAAVAIAGVVTVPLLSADLADRYLSIVSDDTKNAGTAQGRFDGMKRDFAVAMHRPLFGHGLGTSREANANFGAIDKPSHDLYLEVLQELGIAGLIIFVWFILSLVSGLRRAAEAHRRAVAPPQVLIGLIPALQVWIGMDLLFSFASYGLSSYEWYLTAGLVALVERLLHPAAQVETVAPAVVLRAVSPLRPLASRS
jgi:O-antigen ligase